MAVINWQLTLEQQAISCNVAPTYLRNELECFHAVSTNRYVSSNEIFQPKRIQIHMAAVNRMLMGYRDFTIFPTGTVIFEGQRNGNTRGFSRNPRFQRL